ncbi:type I polyketide synthase [Actinomadura livida]|uniref:Enediyne polyketide synthase n=1 Tax=Actinomadura livida TaxID=79909 RepID=A0A7W7ICX5_9ACTN|nr:MULTISPECIES: type I polyketide synthase [Actinomadura]MBB4774778.1 enediyne polyketide synthase [Actinomadura catellatispora]GGU06042.1 polyketide synthase [Actinomadura livida]
MIRLAIVGMGCRYPDAASPRELWENILAGRRAFRGLPGERMRLDDYWSDDPAAPDRFYARTAAVIEGYEFDRIGFQIAGSTYRSTDLTHWLALDVAAQALADAGFPRAEGVPRERTAVVVGNTLTGEFSRAGMMRLRWPYVRRTLAAALKGEGWDDARLAPFLDSYERAYKSPFAPVDEDTLAGGLSNTIAGRICNYFDLKGGGYTVDGACSSSLLSVATAARSLVDGEVDVAIAGGVDLSIDPFEMIGFAKTGALARNEMRVYDRGSNGFWPGEGCGMVVLMRDADARAAGRRIYAAIAGWGISSDGKGGITRPEIGGYRLAIRRAYERAGFGVDTVAMFEGHGTGTPVGDAIELRALSMARRAADPAARPAAIGSIKGMIGHTKAAAGVAGLIKAALSVHHRVVPPSTGCVDPHEELTGERPALRVLRKAEPWPSGLPVRAGVTAMGFGGINTHLVLDGGAPARSAPLDPPTRAAASSVQDAELLLLDADGPAELRDRLARLLRRVPRLAYAELADLAAVLQRELRERPYRAALVVSSPADAERKLARAVGALDEGRVDLVDPASPVFLGHATRPARIGFLFPGQGSGKGTTGGALGRRFAEAAEVYARAALPSGGDLVATAVAQPRIVTGSAAALRVLARLGVRASVAVGHSLGEISALHWAGVMDEDTLLRAAVRRGAAMEQHGRTGAMAGIAAGAAAVERLIGGEPVVIAGYNGSRQTVIAGPAEAVERAGRAAAAEGLVWARLKVSHAFHSPLVAPAADAFGEFLSGERFGPLTRRVVSTVTGAELPADADVPALLRRQITHPVQYGPAILAAADHADLFVEVGPGRVLTAMTSDITDVPAVATDTDDESLAGFLGAVGAAYAMGAEMDHGALFAGRLVRPLDLDAEHAFFASPCEAVPEEAVPSFREEPAEEAREPVEAEAGSEADDSVDVLRRLLAERAELPMGTVDEDSRPLDDLHMSSITVSQVMNDAARKLGLPAAQAAVNFATASVRELADTLDTLAGTAHASDGRHDPIHGVAPWVRPFAVELVEEDVPAPEDGEGNGRWDLYAPDDHPIAESLRHALQNGGVGSGVLICLPSGCAVPDLEAALVAAQDAVVGSPGDRLVLVQQGPGAAGLVKTAHLEARRIRTTIVDIAPTPAAVERVLAEVAGTTGFTEAHYSDDGTRRVPVLRPLAVRADAGAPPLGPGDVLLVTGGGKGITAECALALAADTGARIAVLGRSDPERDAELGGNLARMRATGASVRYVRADVADPRAVRAAVSGIRGSLGPVTAVLHGAGRNEPAALRNLEMPDLLATFAPKAGGLRAVLDAVEPDELRLLVTFGSIIGRAGLPGQADYAAANDWLAALTRDVPRTHPGCRALCLEWSVWSGVGMGERLAVVESLARDGVSPITTGQGIDVLRRLLADPDVPPVVAVTGRTGRLDTLRHESADLPLLRFVDRVLVHYPGVELVTEADLTPGNDPYLEDHSLDGNLLFPAVLGLEAMAQAAAACGGNEGVPVIERAEFARPIVVPPDGATTVRVAALATGGETVDVVIRSSETGYGADHFRATVRFAAPEATVGGEGPVSLDGELPPVPLDPGRDLYGDVLFQGKRFQRLRRYLRVEAHRAEAAVATSDASGWFGMFLPGDLRLGDPGMRDAVMHGIQVCVPDATLLPVGIERLRPYATAGEPADGELAFTATERSHADGTFVYDVTVRAPDGTVVEQWEALRLRAVRRRDGRGPWAPALLGPLLQRGLADALGTRIAVAVEPDAGETRRQSTAVAVGRVLGRRADILYRPDGRPEVPGAPAVSAAHGAGLTLAVAGEEPLGCDLEPVVSRSGREWQDLLGWHSRVAGLLAGEDAGGHGGDADLAATRVWCAIECLQKAGVALPDAPLTLLPPRGDGWSVLAAGDIRVATFATTVRDVAEPVVFAVSTKRKC